MTPVPLFADEVPAGLGRLPAETRQAVVVDDGDGVTTQICGWGREEDGAWDRVIGPVAAVIGRNGLAPAGEKREGDGRAPSGVFPLRRAFGYEERVSTGLFYRRVTEHDFWIDDSMSLQYNQWVSGPVPDVSHEVLRRNDGLYRYAIVIEYNTDPVVANMGSAIFMHVWRAADKPTAGCVAMAEEDLLRFLAWLDARQNPVMMIGVQNYITRFKKIAIFDPEKRGIIPRFSENKYCRFDEARDKGKCYGANHSLCFMFIFIRMRIGRILRRDFLRRQGCLSTVI